MNKERLLAIASMLDEVAAGTWCGAMIVDGFDIDHWVREDSCGTTACAIGYAALDPRIDWVTAHDIGKGHYHVRFVDDCEGQQALGLSKGQFDSLFMPGGYPTGRPVLAADVAVKIREMVA